MTVSVQVDGADREFVVRVGIHLFFFCARGVQTVWFEPRPAGRGSNGEAMMLEKSLICLRDMGLLDIVQ